MNESVIKHRSEFEYVSDKVSVYISGSFNQEKFIDAELNDVIRVEKDAIPEFIAHGYLEAGIDFLKSIEGKFSLVIIDRKIKSVLITSQKAAMLYRVESIDKIPVLLYSNTADKLGPETNVRPIEDRRAIYEYVVNSCPPDDQISLYKGINRLKEGQILLWQKGDVQILDNNPSKQQIGLFEINYEDLKNYICSSANLPAIKIDMEDSPKKGAAKLISTTQMLNPDFFKEFNSDKTGSPESESEVFKISHKQLVNAKKDLFILLLDSRFGNRDYWQQMNVMRALQDVLDGTKNGAETLLRILLVECWFSIFGPKDFGNSQNMRQVNYPSKQRKILRTNPNATKTVKMIIKNKIYHRFPLKTDVFKRGDDVVAKIGKYVITGLRELGRLEKYKETKKERWFVCVSEKIVAITQGRSKFIWEINPGYFAKLLSKYVTKTSAGIGLGSPWTMQLAIEEVGLPRILFAALIAAITKYFGYRGAFYHVAGGSASAIDGPTEYSLFPSNVSAKLGPKNPKRVAKEITAHLRNKLPKTKLNTFDGVAIIDANDIGQKVLGNDTAYSSKNVGNIFKDNPMGQGNEQTPITVIFVSEKNTSQ